MVSAHFAWLAKQQRYVQMVDLDRLAWHAGKKYNGHSIGIEMSGPWDQSPRNPEELGKLRRLVVDLTDALPSLTHWARHSDLSKRKKDPGPGLADELVDEVGLVRHV
jgi:N-acetyl-anhydromuramyl-L-alanine amidase AmpD